MPNTSHGIVYPDETGSTQLWVHFETLAETTDDALDDLVADSGWIPLAFQSGYTNFGEGIAAYRKIGNVVYLVGRVARAAGGDFPSGVHVVATLPTYFMPTRDLAMFPLVSEDGPAGRLWYSTSGQVVCHPTVTGCANLSIAGSFAI